MTLAVDEAYVWSQQVWDLYEQQFGRLSFDGAGSTVTVTVHYGQDYDNAFWDGEQLVFGDGDGEIFERFTKPADVLAHEFSHGVVQYTSAFTYNGQPGALNESIADVFAAMSIQHAAGQTADQASWLIGEGLFKPGINATALRSMLEPGTAYDDPQLGKDPQVGSMADYIDTTEDNGGVHLNSGIPNRAFALAARSVGGHSWEQTGKVWYAALTSVGGGRLDRLPGVRRRDRGGRHPAVRRHGRAGSGARGLGGGRGAARLGARRRGRPDPRRPAPSTPSSSRPYERARTMPRPRHSGATGARGHRPTPQKVAVRRSGGFTGQVRSAQIELGSRSAGRGGASAAATRGPAAGDAPARACPTGSSTRSRSASSRSPSESATSRPICSGSSRSCWDRAARPARLRRPTSG